MNNGKDNSTDPSNKYIELENQFKDLVKDIKEYFPIVDVN